MPQKRIRNGKTRWVARYRDPAGRERSRTFDTRREAQAWEHEREREMRRGEWLSPDDEDVTVGQLAREWARTATRPNTAASRRALVDNLGPLDAMPVRAVRPSHIADWRTALVTRRPWAGGKPLAESTAAIMVGNLSGVLARAHEDGLIARAPRIDAPKAPPARSVKRADLLTTAQVAAMVDAARTGRPHSPARPWLARMILVAAGSGLRVSELGGLRVRDVDFLRREIHVREQAAVDGRGWVPLKSGTSERTVPVPQSVIDVIAEQLREVPRGRDESVWPRDPGRDGQPRLHDRNSVGRALARLVELHGLRPATMHDLRHFYASALIAAGVPVSGVQAALGHASAATTLRVYSHLWPGADDVTRDAAARAFGEVRDQCGTGGGGGGAEGAG